MAVGLEEENLHSPLSAFVGIGMTRQHSELRGTISLGLASVLTAAFRIRAVMLEDSLQEAVPSHLDDD